MFNHPFRPLLVISLAISIFHTAFYTVESEKQVTEHNVLEIP